MKARRLTSGLRGFTLVEMLVGAAMSAVVGLAIFSVVNAGMLLAARNLSVNLTNTTMRGSLDRAEQLIQQADSQPVLIDTAGAAASGPAAGVSFESYLGGPYVISAPPTGLPANTTVLTGKFVRPAALLVMPAGAKRELRYYPLFDATTNLNDPAQYVVLSEQVGMLAADATPFTLVTNQGRTFVNLSLRVRASNFDRRLASKQNDEFNTFARVDSILARKLSP